MKSLLLNYATQSHNECEMPELNYDYESGMNRVKVDGKSMNFIDSPENYVSMTTKTEQCRESDDCFDELLFGLGQTVA